jgi:hypothetical protein
MWFWIWCALVLAALAGGFVLGRSLWRRTKGLLRALDALTQVASRAPARVEERIAAHPPTAPRPPDVFRERQELVDLVAARRALRRARATDRRAEHTARYESWRTIDL